MLLSWSGGKDAAWALHVLRQDPEVELAALFTTIDETTARVPIHEVHADLLAAQARAAGVPIRFVPLPPRCRNAQYERAVLAFLSEEKEKGATHVAFGDLFLEDIRRYRERQLGASGLGLLFPLWGKPTAALAREMTAAGLQARITSVDASRAPGEWAGRVFDAAFVAGLPAGVDPCGENGEFHTFVFEGPMLRSPVPCRAGPIREAAGFAYSELSLA